MLPYTTNSVGASTITSWKLPAIGIYMCMVCSTIWLECFELGFGIQNLKTRRQKPSSIGAVFFFLFFFAFCTVLFTFCRFRRPRRRTPEIRRQLVDVRNELHQAAKEGMNKERSWQKLDTSSTVLEVIHSVQLSLILDVVPLIPDSRFKI